MAKSQNIFSFSSHLQEMTNKIVFMWFTKQTFCENGAKIKRPPDILPPLTVWTLTEFSQQKSFSCFFRCYCGTKGWWKSVWSMRVIKLQRQLFSGAPPTFVLGLAPIITEARKNAWFSRASYSLCTVLLCFFLTHWPK